VGSSASAPCLCREVAGERGDGATRLLVADELIELDERSILVIGRIHGRGKQSGADTEARTFDIWTFEGGEVIGQHQSFDRESALEAAGLSE